MVIVAYVLISMLQKKFRNVSNVFLFICCLLKILQIDPFQDSSHTYENPNVAWSETVHFCMNILFRLKIFNMKKLTILIVFFNHLTFVKKKKYERFFFILKLYLDERNSISKYTYTRHIQLLKSYDLFSVLIYYPYSKLYSDIINGIYKIKT